MVMRICSGPGCGRAVPDAERFCRDCQGTQRPKNLTGDGIREHRPAGKAAPSYRNGLKLSGNERSADDPFQGEYMGKAWREGTRKRALQRSPFCDACKISVSAVVDHRVPARVVHDECVRRGLFPLERLRGFHLAANLTGLCHGCHNEKTAREAGSDWADDLERLLCRFKPGIQIG